MNAQWNQPKDRTVYLHRHPAFFGDAADVIGDCCGCCPKPSTDEELKISEEERKIYISGPVTFMKDDPGRQEIGSFNPITEIDWTGRENLKPAFWTCIDNSLQKWLMLVTRSDFVRQLCPAM